MTVGEFVAFTIGWNLILEYVIGASSVARGLSGYIDQLVGGEISKFWLSIVPMNVSFLAEYPDILSFSLVAILTVILASGVKESSIVHSVFTVINMCTIILVIVAGSIKADPSNWAIPTERIPEGFGSGGFMPFGIAGVMAGAAKCFYGFIGFDCVATAGEEAKNPKRNVPLAIILTLTICVAVYVSISTVLTMMWPYYAIDPNAPLPHIFNEIGWHTIKWIVSIAAIFALFSSLLGSLYSMPRVCYAMGNDGVLFKFMGRVHPKTKTPMVATIISGFLSATMAAVFSLHQLVDMLSIGTLLAYSIVAICVLVLRYGNDKIESNSEESKMKKFLGFNKPTKPNSASSKLAKIGVVIFSIFAIVLGCLITYVKFTAVNIALVSTCAALMMILIVFIALQPTDTSLNIAFKVQFVPFLPCLSIFLNIFLMLQLDGATWIRFGVWLIVGYLIYFLYGIKSSAENKKSLIYENRTE